MARPQEPRRRCSNLWLRGAGERERESCCGCCMKGESRPPGGSVKGQARVGGFLRNLQEKGNGIWVIAAKIGGIQQDPRVGSRFMHPSYAEIYPGIKGSGTVLNLSQRAENH
ncbi:unnamed protein product [Natator depressus]